MLEVVRLNRIFRQASKSNIILNAHRVNEGKTIEIIDDENHIKDLELYYLGNMEMMKTILFKKLEDYRNNYIRKTIKGDFLLESHTTFCFNELLRGRNFRCEELEYMLRDLNFIQIVVVLIFNWNNISR